MGAQRESRAFRKGFVLGAFVGAGVLIWNAPQPGWRTREQIMEMVEGVLFNVLDMPEKVSGMRSTTASDTLAAEEPAAVVPPIEVGTDIVLDGPRPSELAR
jgi:hypothetical protein